jgi:2,4-dienoyl-CoA reductase-like NADH-dependent reductase (Old Yellow Enzyme family)
MEVGMQKNLYSFLYQRKGVDLIDVSSGALVPYQKIPVAPNYQVPFAEKIKKESGILTGAVVLITPIKPKKSLALEKQTWFYLLENL